MDRFDAMAAFVAVADHRGFTRAARQLGVAPSSVTRAVAALEDHLSTRLLQRTTRAVSLTPAGARYLDQARRILAELGEAEATARAETSEPRGRLAITAPSVFGRRQVAPLLADFLARHPQVRGELVVTDRVVNLVEEEIDVAVRIGVLDDSSLRARRVGVTRRVVVASPSYLAERRRPRRPQDLGSHAIIQFRSINPGTEWRFFRRKRAIRVDVRPAVVTNDAEAAIAHAERGLGLAMVLAYQVVDLVRARKLEIVLPGYEPPPIPIHMVYPAGRHPPASVRALIDLAASSRDWRFVDL